MKVIFVDPRALKENPDRARRTKSTSQADALLLASIKAVGVVQAPIVAPEPDGGNGYVIDAGHRRTAQAIAAGLEEIAVLVVERAEDGGAMRSIVENIAREPLNPIDQWRAIERLVALGWTEESIAIALALPVRQIRKLRLLANIMPGMLDQMAKGDTPNEQNLRAIAAASLEEQAEVWKKFEPRKGEPQASWQDIARALSKRRMEAKHASFGDDLASAYGIVWQEDLFAPADEDSRYTTDVEAFFGAQQEWLANNLPKRGAIIEASEWGQPKLPPKAERVYGKPGKTDHTGWFIDARSGVVQSVAYRLPQQKKVAGKDMGGAVDSGDVAARARARHDVTQKGMTMIGDLRTDALHEALARAPIEDDTLLALLVLAFAGANITIATGSAGSPYGYSTCKPHAARLIGEDGKLSLDRDILRQAARLVLTEALSCRENRSNSGIVARIAGDAIGADEFLPNMGTEEFLSSLSRNALEASLKGTPVLPRNKVRDTRAALVQHFGTGRFVHPAGLFAPTTEAVSEWLTKHAAVEDDNAAADEVDEPDSGQPRGEGGNHSGDDADGETDPYAIAAE